jgi:hypothetical protein
MSEPLTAAAPRTSSAGAGARSSTDALHSALADTRRILEDVFERVRTRREEPLHLPMPVLASRHRARVARDYLTWWIRHPDPTGTFAARTRWLRWLPAPLLLRLLFARGYDGLVYLDGDDVVGHVFFQRRGPALYGFSTAVNEPFDGAGYSVVIMLDYVTYASQVPGIARARVGRGQNNTTRRFLQRLKKHERRLAWHVDADGWVTFREPRGKPGGTR